MTLIPPEGWIIRYSYVSAALDRAVVSLGIRSHSKAAG